MPLIIGISGISGSGKTYLIKQLIDEFPLISALSYDDFYKPHHEQMEDKNGFINYDLPDAVDKEKFIDALSGLINGKEVRIKKYPFEKHVSEDRWEVIKRSEIILCEGLYLFEHREIDALMQYRVFVETELKMCFERRIKRDVSERGIKREKTIYQWNEHVLTSYKNHILPHKKRCDLVVRGDKEMDGFDALKQHIKRHYPRN